MKYNPIEKIILFGGSLTIVGLAKWLKNESIEVIIYTSTRHTKEQLTANQNLEELIEDIGIEYIVTENINTEGTIYSEITTNTVGIGIGEAWSFDASLINKFNGKLLDFMGIPLPRYRGGAHYTWMILGGEIQNGMRLQVINEDMIQGVFDSGQIIESIDYEMKSSDEKPSDFFTREVSESIEFIKQFLKDAINDKDFILQDIDESKSIYFPRLYTDIHAWIDWRRWNCLEIVKFILAFDDPYMGARTCICGLNVRIKGVKKIQNTNSYHPFQSGLIVRIHDNLVYVSTKEGLISIGLIMDDKGVSVMEKIKIGQRFFTPEEKLEEALTFQAVYDASGLKK
jgi:methionyl-tRNA formyltransferase